jgi:hypothetical protein
MLQCPPLRVYPVAFPRLKVAGFDMEYLEWARVHAALADLGERRCLRLSLGCMRPCVQRDLVMHMNNATVSRIVNYANPMCSGLELAGRFQHFLSS